jgi:putative membrane protein
VRRGESLILSLIILYGLLTLLAILRDAAGQPYAVGLRAALPILGTLAAFVHAWKRRGLLKASLLFGLTFSISLLFEGASVLSGVIYGQYHYTGRLGPQFLDLVPFVIPAAWFMMLYPAYVIASWLVRPQVNRRRAGLQAPALVGLILVSWDLVMEPLMTSRQLWIWDQPGVYFGIPLQNFAGWWLTGFIIVLIYLWMGGRLERGDWSFDRWMALLLAVNFAGNALDSLPRGLYLPPLLATLALLAWLCLFWRAKHHP